MDRRFWIAGCVMAFLAVALGAFGAHGLRDRVAEELISVFETGARYHMYHALALLITARVAAISTGRAARMAGSLFLAGILLFSGSLYLLAVTGVRWLGAVTPLGGVAFLGGWVALAFAVRGVAPRASSLR